MSRPDVLYAGVEQCVANSACQGRASVDAPMAAFNGAVALQQATPFHVQRPGLGGLQMPPPLAPCSATVLASILLAYLVQACATQPVTWHARD